MAPNDKDRKDEAPGLVAISGEQFQALLSKIGGNGLTAEQLEAIVTRQAQTSAEAMRKSLRPENPVHPGVSVFNPKGERDNPKPRLGKTTYLCGHRVTEDELTPDEIALLNRFTATKTARGGDWQAAVVRNGSTDELRVSFPCGDVDKRMELPSLVLILRELLEGKDAADPDALARRVAELEAKLGAA